MRPPSPELVQWFLKRELDSFDYLKELSEQELDDRLARLKPVPQFHVPLFRHQKVMFLLGVQYTNFLFFADLGAGKTALTLNIISYLKQSKRATKALVLVPNLVLIDSWLTECAIHTPHLKALSVHGTKQYRLRQLKRDADIYVLNYAGLQSILSKTTGKRTIYPEDIRAFADQFHIIAYDEITAVKHITSITHKICSTLSQRINYRYGLTGRPFGRHIEDLWAQFYAIDLGKTLGNNFFMFRSVFFKAQRRPWAVEWKFNKDLTDKLHDILKNRSIRFQRDECITLPKLVPTPLPVKFPAEAATFFNAELEAFNNNRKAGDIDKTKASFIKMREIASGFVNYKDEQGETQQIVFKENPKLDLLVENLQQMPETEKAVVFHDFTFSGEQIVKALTKAKIGHRWVYGGTPDKKKLEYIRAFKFDPKVQVLVVNSASGAFGLNLQHASYMFFFECPVDPLVRYQAEGRLYRTGQTKVTNMYDLLVLGSIEGRILQFIKEGKNLLSELIENRDKFGEAIYVE